MKLLFFYGRNWAQMNPDKKEQLYSKILVRDYNNDKHIHLSFFFFFLMAYYYVLQGKYNLPEKVDEKPVIDALSFQCSSLYRHWRYRLKEKHFRGKSLAQAKDSRPLTVDKAEWDWLVFEYWNSDKQKVIGYMFFFSSPNLKTELVTIFEM